MNKTAIVVSLVGSIPLIILGITSFILRGIAMTSKAI